MNTGQIEKLLKTLPNFLGVFASDKIPKILPRKHPQCFVVNLDPSWKPGSHWIAACFRKTKKKNVLEIFDSYGMAPNIKTGKEWKIIHNPHKFQKMGSIVCGHYSVYFVKNRLKGKTFKNILKSLLDKTDPDTFVENEIITPNVPGRKQVCKGKPLCPGCCAWYLENETE